MMFTMKTTTFISYFGLILAALAIPAAAKDKAVLCVQQQLSVLGYDVGTPDGEFGKRTAKASADYRAARKALNPGAALPELTAPLSLHWCDALSKAHTELASYWTEVFAGTIASLKVSVDLRSGEALPKNAITAALVLYDDAGFKTLHSQTSTDQEGNSYSFAFDSVTAKAALKEANWVCVFLDETEEWRIVQELTAEEGGGKMYSTNACRADVPLFGVDGIRELEVIVDRQAAP